MNEKQSIARKPWLNWLLFGITLVVVFVIGMLTATIVEHRAESVTRIQFMKPIKEWEPRNEVWGESFPKEYESYRMTLDTSFRSKYGGSAKTDILAQGPELVILWAGYPFSKEYNQARGHAYAVTDVRNILRTGGENSTMPATCWTCKGPDVPRLMNKMTPAGYYKGKWIDLGAEVVNPIGCADCHDPKTMELRITRPALVEAMARRGKKMDDFTDQEMHSLVCAQCHVEYYFNKSDNYLNFPWDKGFSADSMEAYYDAIGFYDFVNPLSKAKIIKAQHPDYELYTTGIHAQRGVSCADCHMPYKMEGGIKYTDHHVQSPLNNIANSCQVCHRESEKNLIRDVTDRQDKVTEIRRITEKSLAALHIEAKTAWDNGATEQEMEPVLKLIRSAQFRWDWVAAANAVGFHAPVEALRVLGTSIERAEKARGMLSVILVRHGVQIPIKMPDISSKEKAQKYIGLDIQKLRDEKKSFLEKIAVEWDKKAQKRQGTLIKY